ncbi:MAG: zinc-dependent alcohol dehydrogenase family protein [Gammaproteobacteria bacterium]|nr:zinc-dependent alcohol dehydrogenase family protein [Gammaproteobacteria bacterium]
MKAIVMKTCGGPEVLQLAEIALPQIEHGHQVRVRLKAAGVNPIDTKLRARGSYYPQLMPTVLGCDGAGVIESVGPEVTAFTPGDEVYFCRGGIGGPQGNYAEYAVVDARYIARKPAALDFAHAAAAPLVLITAWEALHGRAAIKAGEKVLIHAGAGGVGHVAIQLAKLAGCEVLTTVGSEEKAAFVKALGADVVVNYRDESFVEAALRWSGDGTGVDVVFDTVGGAIFEQSFAATRPYGHLVTLLQPEATTNWKVARLRNLTTSLELMLSPMYLGWAEAERQQAEILTHCAALLDAGQLQIHLAATLPLAQAAEAHRRIEQGGMQGKLVLEIE